MSGCHCFLNLRGRFRYWFLIGEAHGHFCATDTIAWNQVVGCPGTQLSFPLPPFVYGIWSCLPEPVVKCCFKLFKKYWNSWRNLQKCSMNIPWPSLWPIKLQKNTHLWYTSLLILIVSYCFWNIMQPLQLLPFGFHMLDCWGKASCQVGLYLGHDFATRRGGQASMDRWYPGDRQCLEYQNGWVACPLGATRRLTVKMAESQRKVPF